ncbi:hypothetical protein [Streptomyces sp. NPDC054804]
MAADRDVRLQLVRPDDRRRGGLVRALSANGRLQALAANPLLLTSSRSSTNGTSNLTTAAAASEGAESVGWLIRFLPGGDLHSMHFPQAHHHAYEASRRARVRVLRDGSVRPIAVTRDGRAGAPAPPPRA